MSQHPCETCGFPKALAFRGFAAYHVCYRCAASKRAVTKPRLKESKCSHCGRSKVRYGRFQKWRCMSCSNAKQQVLRFDPNAGTDWKNERRVELERHDHELRWAEIRLAKIKELGAKIYDPVPAQQRRWRELAQKARRVKA